ncbi:pentapeptide repeat-containing protein [Thalassolituus marinus]|uniref:Pentapeptide repeat-containing protein n=1 Tax=Thalassolituus marinus TaxID=671053 RepID=A0ABS7ZT86_9GAMM|nr:pentapeptide repeat-containing protein [Thalassolituus marinus]MCA6064827.1 pentapeptide repeat-containing protein [Thalassolituus marinus]
MKIRDQSLNFEILELDGGTSVLGPGLILNDCTVDSRVSSEHVIIAGLTMTGGNFNQHVELRDFHFENAHLEYVTFTGEFVGCDFGDWDDISISSIKNCNFENCKLDGVRFLNSDMDTITLPGWPHFHIRFPEKCKPNIGFKNLPRKLGITLEVYFDEEPECSAIVGNAQRLAEDNGISLGEIREMLSCIDGVDVGC